MSESVRVESQSRWDALALARRLPAYRWHLLQPDADRWYVCLQLAEQRDTLPEDLMDAIQRWLGERHLAATVVHTPAGKQMVESAGSGGKL